MATDPFLSSRETHGSREPSFKVSARQLGVLVLFTSLTVLFAGSIVAYVITRMQNDVWRTARMPGLPLGLLGSSALLVGLSGAMHHALASVRKNRFESLTRALWLALVFAIGFLLGQAMNWHSMTSSSLAPGMKTLYVFTFFMLTGLHAVHVVGGFVPLAIVIVRARRREYTSSRYDGVKFCAQYWDFLLVVWLVLLTTLYLAT